MAMHDSLLPDPEMSAPEGSIKSVCVYCGSSFGSDGAFRESARDLGQVLAGAGIRLVYGGGGVGLMGETARAVDEAGGKVLGIIPKFLRTREVLYDDVETRIVDTMHERKIMMFEEADAFVVLPGGIGTLEEVVELLSWRRLDLHAKPIVFLNVRGFWDPFFTLIDHLRETQFAPEAFVHSFGRVDAVEDVLPTIARMRSTHVTIDNRSVV